MPSLSRFEMGVVASVSVAGAAVAGASALAQSLGTLPPPPPPPCSEDSDEIKLTMPKLPRTCDEFCNAVAENYMFGKEHFPKLFRFVGQMLVAPIAIIGLDAAYSAYTARCDAAKSATRAASTIPADVRARAIAGGCPVL